MSVAGSAEIPLIPPFAMKGIINIYLTSCETLPGAWRDHEDNLREFYQLSDRRYNLVSDPAAAEVILIGNVREENWGEKTLKNELLNRWPGKCFSLSDQDKPLILNRGIYASGTRSLLAAGRVRSGSYSAYPRQFQNPFSRAHTPSDLDYADKRFLFSFVGRNSDRLRRAVFNMHFNRSDILIEDSSDFDLWKESETPNKEMRQRYYYDTLLQSKFSLCLRGAGASSLRLFESLKLGVAPVIVSDKWIFPKGPRWKDCSIIIKGRHLDELEAIVSEHEPDFERMGRAARRVHDEYFSDEAYFNYVVDNCLAIRSRQIIPEALYWRLNPSVIFAMKSFEQFKEKAKSSRWLGWLVKRRSVA
jgi:hypothetical protein